MIKPTVDELENIKAELEKYQDTILSVIRDYAKSKKSSKQLKERENEVLKQYDRLQILLGHYKPNRGYNGYIYSLCQGDFPLMSDPYKIATLLAYCDPTSNNVCYDLHDLVVYKYCKHLADVIQVLIHDINSLSQG